MIKYLFLPIFINICKITENERFIHRMMYMYAVIIELLMFLK